MTHHISGPKTQKDQTESLARLLGSADHLKIHLGLIEAHGLTPGALPDLRRATKNFLSRLDAHGALIAGRPEPNITTPAHQQLQARIGNDLKGRF